MTIKLDDDKIIGFLEKIKPKIQKELLQAPISDREDLQQEMILFILKVLKEKEFEELDFFKLLSEGSEEQN